MRNLITSKTAFRKRAGSWCRPVMRCTGTAETGMSAGAARFDTSSKSCQRCLVRTLGRAHPDSAERCMRMLGEFEAPGAAPPRRVHRRHLQTAIISSGGGSAALPLREGRGDSTQAKFRRSYGLYVDRTGSHRTARKGHRLVWARCAFSPLNWAFLSLRGFRDGRTCGPLDECCPGSSRPS